MEKNLPRYCALAALALVAAFSPVFASGSSGSRSVVPDIEREAGAPLADDEKQIAAFVFVFYNAKYGYATDDVTLGVAADRMTNEEYENTVRQAAKIAKNPLAKGLLATGKAGEKVLKALIVTTEDAARSTGAWIEKQSKEYDKRNR